MPRPRFNARSGLVVLILVAGSIYGADVMRQRRARFADRAEMHARTAAQCRDSAADMDAQVARWERDDPQAWARVGVKIGLSISKFRARAREARENAARYDAKRLKFERAARYPWLPGPPQSDYR